MHSFGKLAVRPENYNAFTHACQNYGLRVQHIKGIIYEVSAASPLQANTERLRQAVGLIGLQYGDFSQEN